MARTASQELTTELATLLRRAALVIQLCVRGTVKISCLVEYILSLDYIKIGAEAAAGRPKSLFRG